MTPLVSLDVLPAGAPARDAPAMVAACSGALAKGRCALSSDLPESARPQALALVLWQDDRSLEVTVRVGRGDGEWIARALTFSEQDSMTDRWTTVGLTVAALVDDTLPAREPTPPAALPGAAAEPRELDRRPVNEVAKANDRRRWLHAQVGLTSGPGWQGGKWQRGGWLSFGSFVPRTPLALHLSASYALSSGPTVEGTALSTHWMTGAVGLGVGGQWQRAHLSGSAALEVALRRVSTQRDARHATDWEVPVRLRLLAAFPAEGPIAVTAGGNLRIPPQPAPASETHARLDFAAELLAGLEVRL